MKKTYIILFFCILISLITRFYKLGSIPVGFHRDEAFLGYNAYSLLRTARDMTGNLLPLHLESFIYSPSGYSYFSIIPIWIFGLNEFSVRFASAFFGILTIPLLYFLTKELSDKSKPKNCFDKLQPIIACLLLSISPWHINLSRTATENTIAVFSILLGVYLYFLWINRQNYFYILFSFLSFTTTMFIYQAPRVFLPLFIPILIILLKTKSQLPRNILKQFMLYFFIIIIPLLFILSSRNNTLRMRTVSIFATGYTQLLIDEYIREDGVNKIPAIISRAFHNKFIGYTEELLKNYSAHFSFDFLFTDKGLPDRYRVPGHGLLYIFEIPIIVIGFIKLLTKKSHENLIILSLLLLTPIGSALAFDDVPNLQRTMLLSPIFALLSASGICFLLNKISHIRRLRLPVYGLLIVVIVYSIMRYIHYYYIHQVVHKPWYRHEGYKELVNAVNTLLPSFEKVVITNRESAPTIFLLFFGKYDPILFQQQIASKKYESIERVSFDKYIITETDCPLQEIQEEKGSSFILKYPISQNTLYVNGGLCGKPKKYGEIVKEIKRNDETPIFYIIKPSKTL